MRIPAIAQQKGARVVFTLHDAWLACARGQLVDRALAICPGPAIGRCARCLAPALWAPLPARLATRLPRRDGPVRARRAAFDALRGHVDRFLTPSLHLAARLGLPADHVPLPLVRPIPAAPERIGGGPLRLLFLGSLIPTKGARIALEAFAGLPAGAATLRIVGPAHPYDGHDTYAVALRARAAEVPGARVEPPVAHGDVPALLAEADVLVFPSTWEENSPLVLREAAAAGLRIVASDVPGATEVLGAEPRHAVLVEPGSAAALRRALAAEVRRGQARVPPLPGGDMDSHARRILAIYGTLAPRDATPASL
jgi:glycosyltransferase involved in cell wall biosynthesis